MSNRLRRKRFASGTAIKPEDYPRWVQAGLERELEAIIMMARAFRGRTDAESAALIRQIEARCAQLRGWIKTPREGW